MRTTWKTVSTLVTRAIALTLLALAPLTAQGVQQMGGPKDSSKVTSAKPAPEPKTALDSSTLSVKVAVAKRDSIKKSMRDSIRTADSTDRALRVQAGLSPKRTVASNLSSASASDTIKKARSDNPIPVRKEEQPTKKPTPPTPAPVAVVKQTKPDSSEFFERQFGRRVAEEVAGRLSTPAKETVVINQDNSSWLGRNWGWLVLGGGAGVVTCIVTKCIDHGDVNVQGGNATAIANGMRVTSTPSGARIGIQLPMRP